MPVIFCYSLKTIIITQQQHDKHKQVILQVSLCACVCVLKCQTIKMWLKFRHVWQKCCISCLDIIASFTQNYIFRGSEVTGRTDKQFLGQLSHETGKKKTDKRSWSSLCLLCPVISVHVALVGCVDLWDQHPKTGSLDWLPVYLILMYVSVGQQAGQSLDGVDERGHWFLNVYPPSSTGRNPELPCRPSIHQPPSRSVPSHSIELN